MRGTLPQHPFNIESGTHWVCYHRNGSDRFYFDSYGQIIPVEIHRYLKRGIEFKRGSEVIQRNTDIVQAANTSVCGHLCLFALQSLTNGEKIQSILNHMRSYGYT